MDQKSIQSKLNALKARRLQVEASDLFSEDEKTKQIETINKNIQEIHSRIESDPAITRMVNAQIAKVNYHELNN